MKKKILLASLCIPALFAACSSEEFADVQVNTNREKINIELASPGISFNGSADTRMGATETPGNGVEYSWIDTDKLGAAVLDGAVQGTINGDDKALFNYAFNREGNEIGGSKFTAASPVMMGIYTFYHQYNASVQRDKVAFKIEEGQVYDATNGKSAVAQMAQYVKGISPAVDLTSTGIAQSDAANLQLPVKFANFGVPFKFEIKAKNLPAGGAKLEKIIITANGGGTIANGGNLDFSELTTDGNDRVVVDENSTIATLEESFVTKVKAVVDNVNDAGLFTDVNNSNSISVSVKGSNNDGIALGSDVITVYVVMPNNSTSKNYDIKIQTSEGYYQLVNKAFKFASTGGTTEDASAGVVAPGELELDFNTNGTGNIEQPTVFNIPSEYSWNEALKYINNHPALYMTIPVEFNLTGDADIDVPADATYAAFQDLKLTLTSNGNKLTVKNDVVGNVKIANWTFADDAKIELAKDKTMNIETLPALSASVTFINNGTLALNGATDATNLKVENNKTLNMLKDASLAELKNTADATVNVSKKLTVASLTTNGNEGRIEIKSGGELATTAVCTNDGVIDILKGGKLTIGGKLTNKATINNAGTITSGSPLKIANENSGEIILKKGGVSNGATGGVEYDATSGKVVIEDIADFVSIDNANKYQFTAQSTVTTEVSTLDGYNSANNQSAISDITLNGGIWKIAASADADKEVIAVPAKNIITKGSTTLMFDDATALSTALAKLTIDAGITELKSVDNIGTETETETSSTAAIKVTKLIISKDASLQVPASITVNQSASNAEDAKVFGVLNVDGIMNFVTATVGADDNSEAKLTLNPHAAGVAAAQFKVSGTFDNWGTVSAVVTATDDVRGEVSQATNKGNGKLIGEWN